MSNIPDIETIKTKIKATWMSGDYGEFAKYMEPGARTILAGLQLDPGTRMLDVGCGAGQIAIPAAQAGIDVTGVDIASNLIQRARERAAQSNMEIQFDEGDAEQLPYPDESFDVVISLLGAMFAPRPERVAAELTRVTRIGGKIILVNWTPSGLVGEMFKTIAKYVPPLPSVPSAPLWGDESVVRQRLSAGIQEIKMQRKFYPSWSYPFPVAEVVAFFRTYYGPILKAFSVVNESQKAPLQHDLETVFSKFNRSDNQHKTRLEAEYLEIIAVRG